MADFRNPSRSAASGSNAEDLLRPLVTCGICMELYVDPVALLDCLHLACGSCAKEWLEQSSTCHQCRERVRGTRDSHHTAAIVEAFQSIVPNSSLITSRTSEEVTNMRERYRPGQGAISRRRQDSPSPEPPIARIHIPPTDLRPPIPSMVSPLSGDVFSEGAGRTQMWSGNCPFCNPNNGSGYVCPRPCPPPITRAEQHTISLEHTVCAKCTRFLPVRNDLSNSRCVVCSQTSCSELGRRCQEPRTGDEGFQLTRLRDVTFPEGRGLDLTHAFGTGHYERGLFASYVRQRSWNLQQLLQEALSFHRFSLRRARWHGHPFAPSNTDTVNQDDMVCANCASDLVEANIFEWWLAKRPESGLPFEILSRPDCENGIECHVVRRDQAHARAFNHICRPTTPSDDRRHHGGDVPERGDRYVANSDDLDRSFPDFSTSQIIFRDKGKEPVFLCSSVCRGGSTIPGKVTLWHDSPVSVYYGASGAEHTHSGVVQVLMDTRNMHWVRTSNGVIPAGCRPVSGGLLADQQLFHCAVWWRGQRIPGYTSRSMGHAAITWGGSEWYFRDQYELLCWD
ncbi:E3 ubiquitin-protein ligase CHFR OS=Danio rerio GN=chfr PE=2 SV=1 [Rhizoctonia solani AG-1 IB]|uniref:E3 ubiquitin-protein ligase CHFR n=1 Tax=Thanatephorus cucumeris (strain AG1-IB / isolate 7/3/14) TaxID=1108050 RepID=A0A0B7FCI4_THACB|nr:E3 ubiquitin-protein ligase CHFR OS=Danio rerio GN=chfr PE=2 SV=1 [Rhizoctonia solani AG-1 IB]